MKNGSLRAVIDTNVLYSFFHNPFGSSGEIILKSIKGEIELYAPDIVYEEMLRIMTNRLGIDKKAAANALGVLPVKFIERPIYEDFMVKTDVIKHKPDRPVLALALALNCGILTFDKHFKAVKRRVKLWTVKELVKSIG